MRNYFLGAQVPAVPADSCPKPAPVVHHADSLIRHGAGPAKRGARRFLSGERGMRLGPGPVLYNSFCMSLPQDLQPPPRAAAPWIMKGSRSAALGNAAGLAMSRSTISSLRPHKSLRRAELQFWPMQQRGGARGAR